MLLVQSSISGIIPFPSSILFSTTKAAVRQRSRNLIIDLGRFNIRIRLNSLCVEYKIMFQKNSHKSIMKSLIYLITVETIDYIQIM